MFAATGLLPSSPSPLVQTATEAPIFTSNGLLGSTEASNVNQDASSLSAPLATTSTPSFTSNGLLGTSESTSSSQDPSTSNTQVDAPTPTTFTSNGLLGEADLSLTNQDATRLTLGSSLVTLSGTLEHIA